MIAYFDMFSGVSGDMVLGAFIDLGVPVEWLKKQFKIMPLPEAEIRVEDIWHNSIKAVNLFVDDTHHSHHDHHHNNKHHFDRKSLNNENAEHNHLYSEPHHHHSRNYCQIKELISNSPFSDYVKSSALKAFEKIAVAESEIHGTEIEKVHFHEVGGIDAIVDITGAFLCAEYLGITNIYGSILPLGRGSVKCIHGVIPVPAPATLKILKGIPVKAFDSDMETVTPTGAAIITTMTQDFGNIPEMVIKQTGYGSGKRKSLTGLPNFLRIITGELHLNQNQLNKNQSENKLSSGSDDIRFTNKNILSQTVYVAETSIDDMNPEIAGYIMEKLFEDGALDVTYTPIQMKKNRPAFKLQVICVKEKLEELIEIILTESTSSGVRFYKTDRAVLARKSVEIETLFGKVRAKEITDPYGKNRIIPEYEECREIAIENNIPIKDIYLLVNKTIC